jgi:hypothetical protein
MATFCVPIVSRIQKSNHVQSAEIISIQENQRDQSKLRKRQLN